MKSSLLKVSLLALVATISITSMATASRFVSTAPTKSSIAKASANVIDFVVLPRRVRGGSNVGGNVTLDGPAGPGGETINVAYSGPVTGPSSFVIPEGATHGSFTATTQKVNKTTTGTITIYYTGGSWPVTITVDK